jgi:hypothetical protein
MKEESNDTNPPDKKLPVSLDSHLRAIMPDKELNRFREQLPAEFLSDASEGLGQLEDVKQLESVLQQLNQQMHHQLGFKKTKRKRRTIGDSSWTYWAIIVVFLLTIVGFVIIRMMLKH